ncbi:MAG: hypothetical protein BWY77_01594 [bacterium ADurb.Bin431]|nr:MAG: hypothetical protein BWY77_01594 [bacterium ADurb.Bin431]
MTHPPEIAALEQAQGLQNPGALGPRPALADGIALVVQGHRRLNAGDMGGEIALAQKAALLNVPFFQLVGDVAAIKAVGHRLELLFPLPLAALFRLVQLAQGHGQIGVPIAARMDGITIGGVAVPLRSACIEEFQGGCCCLRKRTRSEPLQRGNAEINHCRHCCGPDVAARNGVGVIPGDGG